MATSPGKRRATFPKLYQDWRVRAHTFVLETVLRPRLQVPDGAPLLTSFPYPATGARAVPADEQARWCALLTASHRTFEQFHRAFRDIIRATELPRALHGDAALHPLYAFTIGLSAFVCFACVHA